MEDVQRAIADRVEAIAEWRRERTTNDMFALGSEPARRGKRSTEGIAMLAGWLRDLPADDPRFARLHQLAFSGETFDPGATLLLEVGRFRFHDDDVPFELFFDRMVLFAEQDRQEREELGGPQVAGDDPWRPSWVVHLEQPERNGSNEPDC